MPSSLSGRHQKRLQTVLSRAPQDYLFLKVLFEHTFNYVGQDSHCALPLGSVFWRKWGIVINDLILTWLIRFVPARFGPFTSPRSQSGKPASGSSNHSPFNSIGAPN